MVSEGEGGVFERTSNKGLRNGFVGMRGMVSRWGRDRLMIFRV